MILDEELYLEHFGVMGMRWGVRNDRDGVSRKVDREAAKDAKESAAAKMYYGKGAGTRRKLINNSVDAKAKRIPGYKKKAFDKHLAKQDLSKHADKATSKRKRVDRTEKTRQRAGFFARQFTGEMGTTAAFTAVAAMGFAFSRTPKGKAMMKQSVAKAKTFVQRNPSAVDFLKANGLK